LKVPAGSQSGKLLRIRKRGVPDLKGGQRGDFYVRLMVHVPTGESEDFRQALHTVEAAYPQGPRSSLRL
jgi:curved DNA-binding protein